MTGAGRSSGLTLMARIAAVRAPPERPKRHITVDTLGLPVMITVTPADARTATQPAACSGA